jgi:hypothetical protein
MKREGIIINIRKIKGMDEGFELPVTYMSKELRFPARLIRFGYSYSIQVDVNGTIVSFEKDEERNWRAMATGDLNLSKEVEPALLLAIVDTLDEI